MIRGWWTTDDDSARGRVVFEFEVLLTDLVGVVVEEALKDLSGHQVDLDRGSLLKGVAGLVTQVVADLAEYGVCRWREGFAEIALD